MKIQLLNPVLDTDLNQITLDGYNLTHRFQPLQGSKFIVASSGRVYDPVTGKNFDRMVLIPYRDSFLADEMERVLKEKTDSAEKQFDEQLKNVKLEHTEKLKSQNQKLEDSVARTKESVQKEYEKQIKQYETRVKALEAELAKHIPMTELREKGGVDVEMEKKPRFGKKKVLEKTE